MEAASSEANGWYMLVVSIGIVRLGCASRDDAMIARARCCCACALQFWRTKQYVGINTKFRSPSISQKMMMSSTMRVVAVVALASTSFTTCHGFFTAPSSNNNPSSMFEILQR